MKLLFENLGAIKKADLDLSKKLIIFCGPNGTGKTYVNYAVYGYLRQLYVGVPLFKLNELFDMQKKEITLDYDTLFNLKGVYGNLKKEAINRVFGIKDSSFFNNFKSKSTINRETFRTTIHKEKFEYNYEFSGVSVLYTKKENSDTISVQLKNQVSLDTINETVETFHLAQLSKYLCNRTIVNSYILPVERNSVYTFKDELAVNRLTSKGKLDNRGLENRYPLPIIDALITATDLNTIKKSNSDYYYLAEEIETDILNGKISVSEDGGVQFIPDKAPEITLPVHLFASIIKNISGLIIYLKYQAKKNDLLIIDEPELGLHPDNQILLARIFARLINSGIRLLISTHSDYIIKELNNLIMLSSDKKEIKAKAQELNYRDKEKINPNEVGAYLFNYNTDDNRHVDVISLPVDESGFEIKTIDEAIKNLNEASEELFYSLKYSDND
ncbi:hypothetical protein EZS27_027531 [termite gut metagenome]|uniref:Endonuclease GajA/Old nuclease/RecF-like AAA domain-containing protein n=1 Tax=termite gut metagenome TaxID=433724 RepID=A0A5J4QNV2_9ZZZZ